MTLIRDEEFLTPEEINALPCFTSDRKLQKIDESVMVAQVCQDSTNTSLVIIDFVLVGAFLFTPYCTILEVDGVSVNVNAPLVIGHPSNPNIPISTNCQTFHGQIVFDFGQVIPNFLNAASIVFELGMIGQIPQHYGISFPNQTPTYQYTWTKGILPSPVSITYSNGSYNIVFEYKGNIDCSCNIQCVIPSGVSQNVQFCPDQKQSINVYNGDLSEDPTSILIQLRDSLGNTSSLVVQPLQGTVPVAPDITLYESPRRADISVSYTSVGGTSIEEAEIQILKYFGSVNNIEVWRDWSSRMYTRFTDSELLPNKQYGYAVRFRSKFGDISNLSDWSIVNT